MLNPDYSRKTVLEWVNEMYSGALALTDFQRSRVWSHTLVSRYLKAILAGQPTGTLLMVEPREDLEGRNIDGNDADTSEATTLILDGQQRLTSLWHGMMGKGEQRYYIRVKNLASLDLTVENVVARAEAYQNYTTVNGQFSDNVIPMRKLYDPPDRSPTDATRLENWCAQAIPDDTIKAGSLRRAIEQYLKNPVDQYVIWYAKFTGIDADEAVKIFVDTNRSSVTVKAFDLAVALAVQVGVDIKFRARINQFRTVNDRVKYYFSQDRDRWVPEIGQCLWKIACLKVGENGVPPKNARIEKAVEYLFGDGTANADEVEASLHAALGFLENHGVPTKDFLPRLPPVYVIAALQSEIQGVHETRRSQAINLVRKYMWWSFLSDRYESQANDKLHQDYSGLRSDLRYLQQHGETQMSAPIFNESKMVSEDEFVTAQLFFRAKSPIGRAIAALTLDRKAMDWVTGEELTPSTVRELEADGSLDRHHVFPRKALTQGEGALDPADPRINHGVNIVLLRKKANITLGGKKPTVYLAKLLELDSQLTDQVLAGRVNSHISPYDILRKEDGPISDRYEEFLVERSKRLWQQIKSRVT